MTPKEFELELYREFDWRFDEVNLLKNTVERAPSEEHRETLRKSVVVILYSHFEGFCVFALGHYLTALNAEELRCADAVSAIVAGAWEPVFRAMETGDEKCRIFARPLPADNKLHRHWRRRNFVEEIERLRSLPVLISEDVIDSESNLKPNVLQRNLFLLGLDHKFVEPHIDTINGLLGRRNRIAHGDDRRGISRSEIDRYESMVFSICVELIEFLEKSFRLKSYRVH